MVSKTVKIVNEQGMHMRPASELSQMAGKYECDIKINFNGNDVDVKSIMMLMAACIKFGSEFELSCDGPGEEEALKEITEYIAAGMGD